MEHELDVQSAVFLCAVKRAPLGAHHPPGCRGTGPHAAVKATFSGFFLLRFLKFLMWTILKSLLNLLQYYFCFMFCFFGCKAYGISVP